MPWLQLVKRNAAYWSYNPVSLEGYADVHGVCKAIMWLP